MRFCQYALLVATAAAAAATTLFGSGNVATAVSDRTTGFSTMTPPEVAASFGTRQASDNEKRFLRYHDKENRGGNKKGDQEEEEEGEERKAGVNQFKPTKLDALENQAKHLSVHNLEETKVLKFFNRLAKHKKNNYNFPDVFKQSKYNDLRKLYRTWRYHGRDPFKSL